MTSPQSCLLPYSLNFQCGVTQPGSAATPIPLTLPTLPRDPQCPDPTLPHPIPPTLPSTAIPQRPIPCHTHPYPAYPAQHRNLPAAHTLTHPASQYPRNPFMKTSAV